MQRNIASIFICCHNAIIIIIINICIFDNNMKTIISINMNEH